MGSDGIAGEYFVAAELTRRGMIATPTGKNKQDVDVLAADPNTGKSVMIQVKEKSTADCAFKMGARVKEAQISANVWYVFVDLFNAFQCYVIRAKEMFDIVQARKAEYDGGLKRDGTPRKPDPCFYFVPHIDLVNENGEPRMNNWTDLPIFSA